MINIFGRMSLDGNERQEQGNQASSKPDTSVASSRLPQPPKTPRQSGNSTPLEPRYINEEIQDGQVAPETPDGRKLLQNLEHSFKAIKFAKWAQTPSPTKAPFVNRFSNVTNFIVADIDEKVGQMDRQLTEFKKFMESAEINSVSIKEELELSKKRGEPYTY